MEGEREGEREREGEGVISPLMPVAPTTTLGGGGHRPLGIRIHGKRMEITKFGFRNGISYFT